MRKLLYVGFCLVLAASFGCAITGYALITDNDQTPNGDGNHVVNTNGKAHIIETSKWAFLFGDGSAEEWIAFVDQKADGDRTLTAYGNSRPPDGSGTWHDDLYCNPDWNGCAAWTAPDPEGDTDPFDGSQNVNCTLSGTFSVLVSTGRTGGECGRLGVQRAGIQDQLAFLQMGRYGTHRGMEGLFFTGTNSNLTVLVNNQVIPVANLDVFMAMRGHKIDGVLVNVGNPLMAHTLKTLGNAWPQGTVVNDFAVIYNGITLAHGQNFMKLIGDPSRIANLKY